MEAYMLRASVCLRPLVEKLRSYFRRFFPPSKFYCVSSMPNESHIHILFYQPL